MVLHFPHNLTICWFTFQDTGCSWLIYSNYYTYCRIIDTNRNGQFIFSMTVFLMKLSVFYESDMFTGKVCWYVGFGLTSAIPSSSKNISSLFLFLISTCLLVLSNVHLKVTNPPHKHSITLLSQLVDPSVKKAVALNTEELARRLNDGQQGFTIRWLAIVGGDSMVAEVVCAG